MTGNKQRENSPPKSLGRPKGSPNKLTGEVKAMILAALDQAGGVDYLATQALETPAAFLSLVGKVLPLQLTGDSENPVAVNVIELRAAAHTKQYDS